MCFNLLGWFFILWLKFSPSFKIHLCAKKDRHTLGQRRSSTTDIESDIIILWTWKFSITGCRSSLELASKNDKYFRTRSFDLFFKVKKVNILKCNIFSQVFLQSLNVLIGLSINGIVMVVIKFNMFLSVLQIICTIHI